MKFRTDLRVLTLLPLVTLSLGALRDSLVIHEGTPSPLVSVRPSPANLSSAHFLRIRTDEAVHLSWHKSRPAQLRQIERLCLRSASASQTNSIRHLDARCSRGRDLDVHPLPPEILVAFGLPPDDSDPTERFWSRVPGVGPILAARIQAHWLSVNPSGNQTSLCDIQDVRGVGPKLASRLWVYSRYAERCRPQ